uniref:HTH CENPB-type domain-containing protein n=1 Tax=Knipowitschia caucasica TaxID=637954 RepID=A0AAV2LVG0_KNICA
MQGAIDEVRAGRLSYRQAAVHFGVPKSTLRDRVSGKVASDSTYGQRPLLSEKDENALVEYCLYSASFGFPLTKSQVVTHALAIFNRHHPQTPKVALSQTWWVNFRERQKQRLTTRTPDIIDRGRAEEIQLEATSAIAGDSQPSRISANPGCSSASSGHSTTGLSAPPIPFQTSHGLQLPDSPRIPTRSLPAAPAQHIREPSTSRGPLGPRKLITAMHCLQSSSSPSSTRPMASVAPPAKRAKKGCGMCRKVDPPGQGKTVPWVQCDTCHSWFHWVCVSWEEGLGDFICFWCRDM